LKALGAKGPPAVGVGFISIVVLASVGLGAQNVKMTWLRC
jgi:hypothetical protein